MSGEPMLSNNPGFTMPSMKNEANNNLYVATGTENGADTINCNCAAFLDPFPNQITWRYVSRVTSVIVKSDFWNVLYVTLLLNSFLAFRNDLIFRQAKNASWNLRFHIKCPEVSEIVII